jgi:hypothetical protein
MYIKQPIIVSYKADFEGKSISVTGLGKPWGFQGVAAPRISRQSAYEDVNPYPANVENMVSF